MSFQAYCEALCVVGGGCQLEGQYTTPELWSDYNGPNGRFVMWEEMRSEVKCIFFLCEKNPWGMEEGGGMECGEGKDCVLDHWMAFFVRIPRNA